MFLTPGSSFCMKYIHVSRAWPSLGQVHSEFGSELEQPLATRLHWTKGRNMTSDKLSKKKNSKNLKTKSFVSQTLASLPGTQMIVQSFSSERTNQCPKIIIVTLLLSFLTVTPRGTLDFKALYVTLCVCVCACQSPSWYPILIVYDHRPRALIWTWSWSWT